MSLRIELRTRHWHQNAQNFGPELLDQVPGPKFQQQKIPKYAQTLLDKEEERQFCLNLQ